LAFTASKEVFI